MDLLDLARNRKTVRRFSKEVPPLEDVMYALKVAKEAPSGMNSQPWHFVVVKDDQIKSKIREVCEAAEKEFHEKVKGKLGNWLKETGIDWRKDFLSKAPYLIAVLGNSREPYWIQSVWLSVGYVLLALEEKGLGTVTYTPPNPRDVERVLNVPKGWNLQVILPVGYPDDEKPKYRRKKLENIVSFDLFTPRKW